jgi:hypothetical protein
MSGIVTKLRAQARKRCEQRNSAFVFDPSWQRKPNEFIEWKAADMISLLRSRLLISRRKRRELKAEVERLRANVHLAYYEGWDDAKHTNRIDVDAAWDFSDARVAVEDDYQEPIAEEK